MEISKEKSKLAKILKEISQSTGKYLLEEEKKKYDQINRSDFLWHYLLQSFSTMGRSSGWNGLIGNKLNYNQITFEAITNLPSLSRENKLKEVCGLAKVRMPDQKAKYILGCFN
ncbi:MAG: hypothetical protein ABIP37_07600 [Methylotenera sp.]